MKDGYGIGSEGYGLGRIAYSGKEGWDIKLIPTESNALSDYLKGISL